ncbi:hypothetical protein bpr_II339 (plasmid) [Butyrivibrio proteoclasticus B316]|uniref:Uncharacterized protein n=1 Tax=Butyrivibrio proteoclasticus (strain ATCC 51982 / DSM 14932 / B316) TaxID=515622 RepID=E0S4E4_BUTPB|nr:hypothetical protein [Butyrivibrio proteoclasticus]ADL36276.1 hypothetical protein bpr_II339 [Butyrivibrio proteoclasticus B316]
MARTLVNFMFMIVLIVAVSYSQVTTTKHKKGLLSDEDSKKKHIVCLVAVGVTWLLYRILIVFI